MTVRGWSTLAAATVIAAWLLGAVAFWWQYQQTAEDQARLLTTWTPAAAHASTLSRVQASASEALNNAVIRTELRRPARLEALLGQMRQAGTRLRELLAREPAEQGLLVQVLTAQQAWLQQDLDPTLEALAESNTARAASITASEESANRTEAMLQASAALQSRLQGRLLAQGRVLTASSGSLGNSLFLAMTLLIITIVAGSIAVRLRVVRPVERVGRDVREAAADPAHAHPIPSVGPVEIASLARDAEGLRRQLVAEIDEARAARGALGTHAPLVSAVRKLLHGQQPPVLEGISIFASIRPAEGVIGGDWWQFIRRPQGRWCLVLADVSGHGWESGVVALQLQAVLQTWLGADLPLGRALIAASTLLRPGTHTVPMVILELDITMNRLTYVNAGHPPPLLIDATGHIHALTRTGPLLSCLDPADSWWTTRQLPWHVGDILVAHSDGLIPDSMLRGSEGDTLLGRLPAATPADIRGDADEFGQRLIADIRAAGEEWTDDATLMVILRPRPAQSR